MAYDWPEGWNETRTERAVQGFVCDTLSVPKYAVRCSVDNDVQEGGYPADAQPIVEIFKPLGGKKTEDVHAVFGRLLPFADHALRIGVPEERTGKHSFRLRYVFVFDPTDL